MASSGPVTAGDGPESAAARAGGPGSDAVEQVRIEADRLTGSVKDGADVARTASLHYGSLLAEIYAKLMRGTMREGVEFGEHLAALLAAGTPAEAFRLNAEFLRRRVWSLQDRFLEMAGVEDAPAEGTSAEDEPRR